MRDDESERRHDGRKLKWEGDLGVESGRRTMTSLTSLSVITTSLLYFFIFLSDEQEAADTKKSEKRLLFCAI
jgi:hypothetical protein